MTLTRKLLAVLGPFGLVACSAPSHGHRTPTAQAPATVNPPAEAGNDRPGEEAAPPSTSPGPVDTTTPEPEPEPTVTTVTMTVPTTPRRTTTTFTLPERADEELSDAEWYATQPGYGPWSIPTYVVMCESGGSWTAQNASGAAGPYQLMPEHFGGKSALTQSQAAQHAKAAYLWNGGVNTASGLGPQNWKACL